MTSRAFTEPTTLLNRLLAPFDTATFLDDYWQKQALLIERKEPRYYADILTLEDIDRLLSNTALPISLVNVGQNAIGISQTDYSNGSYASPADMLRLHRAGNTIILRAMQHWLPTLRSLCEGMEDIFLCEAQTNIYLTPANTQSSYPHWDAHDIFVIQIAGSKRWVLHECEMKLPLHTYEFDRARHPVGSEIGEITLRAGDVAYIPRGLAHSPVANDYSVHIALGLKINTWADVLSIMLQDFVTDSVMSRAALPIDYANRAFDFKSARNELARQLTSLSEGVDLERALTKIEDRVFAKRKPKTEGMLSAMAFHTPLQLETVIQIPPGAAVRSRSNGSSGRSYDVFINGAQLQIDSSIADSIEKLRKSATCRIQDLPASSDEHRLALAQKLVDEGCIIART